jgi:pheromone shutdown protein TraB
MAELMPSLRAALASQIEADVKRSIQLDVVNDLNQYLDKVKADFATLIPTMLQRTVQLVEADLQTQMMAQLATMQSACIAEMQTAISTEMLILKEQSLGDAQASLANIETNTVMQASLSLRDKILAIDADLLNSHQAQATSFFSETYIAAMQKTQNELKAFVDQLQLASQQQLADQLTTNLPTLYQAMTDTTLSRLKEQLEMLAQDVTTAFTETLNMRLPEAKAVLADEVNAMLAREMPAIQAQLSATLQQEVKQTLREVRLSF